MERMRESSVEVVVSRELFEMSKYGERIFRWILDGSPCETIMDEEIKQALIAYGDERARKEKEKLSQWMLSMNLSTGHGDTMEDLFKELEWWIDRIMTR